MFTILNTQFVRYLEISKPIDDNLFTEENVRYFDNDGFQLSLLEQEYYKANHVPVVNTLNRAGDRPLWMTCNHASFYLDHSMTPQRWCYVAEAKEQLTHYIKKFPSLIKYINLKSKWGLDFALEYYDDTEALEILHIEFDFRNYYQAVLMKQELEQKISSTDWADFKSRLINKNHVGKTYRALIRTIGKPNSGVYQKPKKPTKLFDFT